MSDLGVDDLAASLVHHLAEAGRMQIHQEITGPNDPLEEAVSKDLGHAALGLADQGHKVLYVFTVFSDWSVKNINCGRTPTVEIFQIECLFFKFQKI